jgi:HSP20 family protein
MEGSTMLIRRFPSLPTWSTAFRDWDEMRRDMDRLFASLGGDSFARTAGVFPPINVSESSDAVFVRAEMPGIDPKKLDIRVEADTLTIAGERPLVEEDDVSYHRREREWGSFRRSFSMPARVDADGVQARYEHGILTVELPKAAEVRPKQITVHAGA